MAVNKKISELVYISSGSIDSTSMIEVVQAGDNYRTTPKDFVQSAIPINIDAFPTGSAPVITTASNLGFGEGIYGQKVGNDLQFKSLIAGNNIALTSNGTNITISAVVSGSALLKNFPLYENMNIKDQAVLMPTGQIRKLEHITMGTPATLYTMAQTPLYAFCNKITDSYFLITYSSNTTIFLKAGLINEDYSITMGSALSASDNTVWFGNVATAVLLSDSKAVFAYLDNSSTYHTRVIGISGASLSNKAEANHAEEGGYALLPITNSSFLSAYKGYIYSYQLSGDLATQSSSTRIFSEYYGTYCGFPIIESIGTNKFLYSTYYAATGATSNTTGSILACSYDSSHTIDSGSVVHFNTGTVNYNTRTTQPSIAVLDDSTFAICHPVYSGGSISYISLKIGKLSGLDISLGEEYVFSSGSLSPYPKVRKVSSSSFLFNNGEYFRLCTLSGSVISSFGNYLSVPGYGAFDISIMNSTKMLFTAIGDGRAYGIAGPISTYTITDKILGILQEGGTAGQYKPVALFSDVSTVHSGLIPGELYYYDTETGNDVITAPVGHLAGLALSTTDLKITNYQ